MGSGDRSRIVEEVARQRLPARPGEGPVGRRHVHFPQLLLGLAPDRQRFLGQMQADLRHQRHREQLGVGADELVTVHAANSIRGWRVTQACNSATWRAASTQPRSRHGASRAGNLVKMRAPTGPSGRSLERAKGFEPMTLTLET